MKIVECPRDAMQGIADFIPTEKKVAYINTLLQVGFDTIDVGSFVSPKAIPQMRDTWKVLPRLDMSETDTKLSVIVANMRGAQEAVTYEQVHYLGFPFSVSEIFQQRNTNASLEKAFAIASEMYNLCLKHDKELLLYFSMAFGNPYDELWHPAIVEHWVDRYVQMGVDIISLSDTVGIATPKTIAQLFASLCDCFPDTLFGAHFHTEHHNWKEKIIAAYENGCDRFDGAIKGYGGCPMAQNDLVGNMPTEYLVQFFREERADFFVHPEMFEQAMGEATELFTAYNGWIGQKKFLYLF